MPFTKYHWSEQINEGTYAGHVANTQKIRYAYKILIRKPVGTPCVQLGRQNGLNKQVGIRYFCSSAMLRTVDWQLATFRDSLSLLSSTGKQSAGPLKMRSVANHWSALRNISEDRRPHLHRFGSLKSLQVRILSLLAGGFPYYPYRSRTGIVLDDTEYKPMGVTNRPIITAPVPGHVGDIFDITVSAIQGPGSAHTGQPFVYPGERFISSKCPKINFSRNLLHLSWNSWVQPSPSLTHFLYYN